MCVCLSIYPSIYPSIHTSNYLSLDLSIYPSVYPSIHLSLKSCHLFWDLLAELLNDIGVYFPESAAAINYVGSNDDESHGVASFEEGSTTQAGVDRRQYRRQNKQEEYKTVDEGEEEDEDEEDEEDEDDDAEDEDDDEISPLDEH